MGQKILIAFDDSENALRAVKYVARTFSPDNHVTLFSVLQDTAALCDMNSPELTPYFKSQQQAFCALEDKKKDLVSTALAKAAEILRQAGFEVENIAIKTEPKKKGIARDIAEEARSGYDLVVLGRRGISSIKDFFLGSISQKVLSLAQESATLIVSSPGESVESRPGGIDGYHRFSRYIKRARLVLHESALFKPENGQLNHGDIDGRRTLLTLFNVKGYTVAFMKRLKTGGIDTRMMNEHIRSVFGFNKTIPFFFVEPLHSSTRHSDNLLSLKFPMVPNCRCHCDKWILPSVRNRPAN
jgi:nucleotide-binding universal stress UspA family protein